MKPLTHCILTGLPVDNFASIDDPGSPQFSYGIEVARLVFQLKFCGNCFREDRLADLKRDYSHLLKPHILKGHLLNGKLNGLLSKVIHSGLSDSNEPKKETGLISILEGLNYPKTRQELLDNLLLYVQGQTKFEGGTFDSYVITREENWRRLYFEHVDQSRFYLDTLCEIRYLRKVAQRTGPGAEPLDSYQLTFSGLNYLAELEEKGHNSQSVFVAMCFHHGMEETRRAIKSAIEANGLSPILIDESQYPSHQTINDALILAIKRSKFIVADFTENRNAVYWEAGYALGLGKEVILTCHREHFQSVDFDTKAFPHIIYDTTDDLCKQLEDRIRVRFG